MTIEKVTSFQNKLYFHWKLVGIEIHSTVKETNQKKKKPKRKKTKNKQIEKPRREQTNFSDEEGVVERGIEDVLEEDGKQSEEAFAARSRHRVASLILTRPSIRSGSQAPVGDHVQCALEEKGWWMALLSRFGLCLGGWKNYRSGAGSSKSSETEFGLWMRYRSLWCSISNFCYRYWLDAQSNSIFKELNSCIFSTRVWPTDGRNHGWTDGRTAGRIDGRTHPITDAGKHLKGFLENKHKLC